MFMNIIKNLDFFLLICKFECLFTDPTYDFRVSRKYKLQPFFSKEEFNV